MGNYISNNYIVLLARRTLARYNTQTRIFKEMEKQQIKPVVAPKFDAEQINYHKLLQDDTAYLKKTMKKNPELDNRLKNVYVTSEDRKIELPTGEHGRNTERTLPLDRTTEEFEFGFKESKVIPPGKVSYMQALKFITDHHSKPDEWTVEKIVKEYEIKDYVANDIIKHFKSYEFYIPGKTEPTLLTGTVPKQIEETSKSK